MWWALLFACTQEPPDPGRSDRGRSTDKVASGHTGTSTTSPTTPCGPLALTDRFVVGQDGAHEPWVDDGPGDMVRGIQGGWHVEVGGRLTAPGAEEVLANGVVRARGLDIGGDTDDHLIALRDLDVCGGTFVLRMFLDPNALWPDTLCSLEGEALEVHLGIEAEGVGLSVDSTLVARLVGEGEDFCAAQAP